MANFLGCSPNAIVAYDFFIGKGLSPIQAAAVVGNLQWESGVEPTKEAMDINRLPSRGIAMWQPPRWSSLQAFASSRGEDPRSLMTQLEFVWFELPTNGLSALRNTSDLESAVVAFQDQFERPKREYAHTDGRIDRANAILECATVRPGAPAPPASKRSQGVVVALAGAAVAAVGFGIYKVISGRELFPERRLPPPSPTRFLPRPRRRREINYRDRLYRGDF